MNLVQQKVAEEESKRLKIAQRIREYDAFIEQAFLDQQQILQSELDPVKMQGFPDYIWRLKQNRFQAHQELQLQEKRLLAARENLQEALIKKKSLDTLKDKDYAKYRKRIEKYDEEFLAELALNRMRK